MLTRHRHRRLSPVQARALHLRICGTAFTATHRRRRQTRQMRELAPRFPGTACISNRAEPPLTLIMTNIVLASNAPGVSLIQLLPFHLQNSIVGRLQGVLHPPRFILRPTHPPVNGPHGASRAFQMLDLTALCHSYCLKIDLSCKTSRRRDISCMTLRHQSQRHSRWPGSSLYLVRLTEPIHITLGFSAKESSTKLWSYKRASTVRRAPIYVSEAT